MTTKSKKRKKIDANSKQTGTSADRVSLAGLQIKLEVSETTSEKSSEPVGSVDIKQGVSEHEHVADESDFSDYISSGAGCVSDSSFSNFENGEVSFTDDEVHDHVDSGEEGDSVSLTPNEVLKGKFTEFTIADLTQPTLHLALATILGQSRDLMKEIENDPLRVEKLDDCDL